MRPECQSNRLAALSHTSGNSSFWRRRSQATGDDSGGAASLENPSDEILFFK
jgi:hypothetical protein